MANFEGEKRVNASPSEAAYEAIRQRIIEGDFLPSQRLVEAQLAESLGFSRHNVRIALDRLHSDGLVRIEPNRGATVATLSLEEAIDILQAREALEGEVARLATLVIDSAGLELLNTHLETMRHALETFEFEIYSATNVRFHQAIYEASGNRTIPEIIKMLRLRLARLQLRTILIPGRSEQSIAEHEAIFEALVRRDGDAAELAARQHVSSLSAAIEKAWSLVRL